MTSDNGRGRDVEPAGDVSEAVEAARRRPRTRVVSEAVVAALSDEPRPRTQVVSEAVAAALPPEGEAEPEGGADDDDGAGA